MLQKRVWCKDASLFWRTSDFFVGTLLTGLSVRPFLDQVSDYFTPRMALLTQPISLANEAPKCHPSLRPSKAVEGQKPPVSSSTGFRLTEPHRPNESFARPTGRIHAGHNPPPTPHDTSKHAISTFLNPCPCPEPSHWSPQNSHYQPSAKRRHTLELRSYTYF